MKVKSCPRGHKHVSSRAAILRVSACQDERTYQLKVKNLRFSDYELGAGQHTAPRDALETISSLTPWLNSHSQASSHNPQFSQWSEKLLAQGAQLAGEQICANAPAIDGELVKTALTLFRLWSAHPNTKRPVSSHVTHNGTSTKPAPKYTIWKVYYGVLTAILRHGLPYVPTASGPERPQFAAEIRRVESIYETNLLQDVAFPTANSNSSQVEDWVEQVIGNWEILCGSHWRDEDVGEGGQSTVGRNVLDVSPCLFQGSPLYTLTGIN